MEGLTLDLTDVSLDGEFDINELLKMTVEREVKKNIKLKVRDTSAGVITLNEILNINNKCLYCDKKVYLQKQCLSCRIHTIQKNIKDVRDYLVSKGVYGCAFCKAPHTETLRGFHFDHLNIYNKADNVGFMLCRHIDTAKIFEEIDKCQLLCVPCHAIVTKIENRNGFIREKIMFNKGKLTTPIEELAADYDRIMIPVYDELKLRLGGAN